MLLGILGWIAVGLLIGFIASKVVDLHGDDPRLGIGVAAGGAILCGVLYSIISGAGVSAWNVWSILCAALGALLGAGVWYGVRSRYVSRERYTTRSSY